MAEVTIAINGITGRMGTQIAAEIDNRAGCRLTAGASHERFTNDAEVPHNLRALGISAADIIEDPDALCARCDVIIDFSLPPATMTIAAAAHRTGTPLVIGTTGLSNAEEAHLSDLAADGLTCLIAPNMGLGINLLLTLVSQAARALDPQFDIEIVEMHHSAKVDAPSGTALGLGKAAAAGRGVDLDQAAVRSRDGHTGARETGTIGFATLRGGDVVGDHSVIFAGPGERIELTHKASSRGLFSAGAVTAALWLAGQPAGLYSMADVLGLPKP